MGPDGYETGSLDCFGTAVADYLCLLLLLLPANLLKATHLSNAERCRVSRDRKDIDIP